MLATGDALRESFCTPDTLQSLLRMQRTRARQGIPTRPLLHLPAFMASWQGFGRELEVAVSALSAFRAPAGAWESDLLPARVTDYLPADLDELLRAGELVWRGYGTGHITVLHPEDLPALKLDAVEPPTVQMADRHARYDFFQLADQQHAPTAQFSAQLWRAIWNGELVSDDFATIRVGLARQFELPALSAAPSGGMIDQHPREIGNQANAPRERVWPSTGHRSAARRAAARGRARGWPGVFRRVEPPQDPRTDAALAELELAKSTARLLLQRYGVLNRELYLREVLRCSWAQVFRALRLMELAGEVIAAQFFAQLATPQFMSPAAAARLMEAGTSGTATPSFWCVATDPVSPCGLGDAWQLPLPRRAAGNYLGFVEGQLAWVIEARGRRVHFAAEPTAPEFAHALRLLDDLLQRSASLGRQMVVQQINGAPAATSPIVVALRGQFAVSADHHEHLQVRPLTRV